MREVEKNVVFSMIAVIMVMIGMLAGSLVATGCNEGRSIQTTVLNDSDAVGWKSEVQGHFNTMSGSHVLTVITAPDGQRWLYIMGDDGRGSLAQMK